MSSHYDYYLQKLIEHNLHEKNTYFKKMPDNICDLNNLIIYGPGGCGKYTQSLNIIKKYSPSELKYEKKINFTNNEKKQDFQFKISDIHYEVDFNLLGCNSKIIWTELYNIITDIILTKPNNHGIILCKNFHNINSDLLDVFYSYMQYHKTFLKIKFIIITEQISFIPPNIIKCSSIISIPRPTKSSYIAVTNNKITVPLSNITNITNINHNKLLVSNNYICDKIISDLKDYNAIKFNEFRDKLYEMLIYNTNIHYTIWVILNDLIKNDLIPANKLNNVLLNVFIFKIF